MTLSKTQIPRITLKLKPSSLQQYCHKYLVISILMLIILPLYSAAQLNASYTPIEPKGTIPERFFQGMKGTTEIKIIVEDERIRKKQSKDFKTTTRFTLQEIFLSGSIYYNDPCTQYVRQVSNQLLRHLPESPDISVFVSRFVTSNAAVWQDGTLILNIGLLAQLENEAQLAFVLAHEIGHHQSGHPFRQYVRTQKLSNIQKRALDNLKANVAYTKKSEEEADAFALDLLAKAGYDTEAVSQTLDLLVHGRHDSSENLLARLSPAVVLCNEMERQTLFNTGENVKSHFTPTMIRQRQEQLSGSLSGQSFLVSEEDFVRVNNIARFELIENAYREADYVLSLLHALLLQELYPANTYLTDKIAENLFQLYLYEQRGQLKSLLNLNLENDIRLKGYHQISCSLRKMDEPALRQLTENYLQQQYQVHQESSGTIAIIMAKYMELAYGQKKARPYFENYLEHFKGGKHYWYAKNRFE